MKKNSRKVKRYRREILRIAFQQIITNNVDAIAVLLFELNCGCMKVVGASENGDKVGPGIMMSGFPAKNNQVLICHKCMADDGSPNRIIRRGIMWKDEKGGKPNERNAIYQKAFGCDAPEIEA